MAVSRLSDIIPLTTMVEADAIMPRRKARRKKKAAKQSATQPKSTGPWPKRPEVWQDEFRKFLKFLGWTECSDGTLQHPTIPKFMFDGSDFCDDRYDYIDGATIYMEYAEHWYADDVKNVLFKESKVGNDWVVNRTEIRLK